MISNNAFVAFRSLARSGKSAFRTSDSRVSSPFHAAGAFSSHHVVNLQCELRPVFVVSWALKRARFNIRKVVEQDDRFPIAIENIRMIPA